MTFDEYWETVLEANPNMASCECIRIKVGALKRMNLRTWNAAQRFEKSAVFERNHSEPEFMRDLFRAVNSERP